MDRTPRNLPPLNLHRGGGGGGGGGLGTGRSLPPTGRSLPRTIPESRCSSASSSVDSRSITSRSTAQISGEFYRVPNGSRSRAMTSRSNPGTSRFPPLKSNPSVNRPPSQNSFFDLKSRFANLLASPRSGTSEGQFIQRSSSEECLKCMLKVPHQRCESHKYIRVGGGYRHSFWYVKALLEEIELRRQQEIVRQQRLEAIHEKQVRAVKTYIRTKSGRMVERIVFLSEEDYQNFKAGGKDAAAAILKKYLNKEEAKGLAKWDKEEQKVITTYIRTKSGRRIAKTVYVNKSDYEAMKRGDVDANALLRKYIKPENGETVEGWGEAEMKTLKTFIRTKSGRLVEKTILVTKEDYEKLEAIKAAGGDPNELLGKYMSMDEGATIESWAKNESKPMNVIKTFVRTKSGRLIEKTVLLTAEEYAEFQASGGDVNLLKRYMDIGKDDVIEDWEKASTVYSASGDEEVENAEAGTRIVGKDGTLYEVVVDEVTGKKYKRKVKDNNKNKKGKGAMEDPNEKGMTTKQKESYRAGKRRDGSDSEYSYKSHVSAGGTRHVQRRRKRGDGTYSAAESYHSDQDVEGKKRRQARRGKRKDAAIKEKKKAIAAGGRNDNSDSDYSYKSVVSAGGTRHVTRRKKLAGGGRGKEETYDENKDIEGKKRRQARRKQREEKVKKGGRDAHSAGSAYSYRSVISAGGTRHVTRMKRLAGGKRGKPEEYHSDQDEEGKKRRQARRKQREEKVKKGGRDANSAGSAYSYRSVVSAGGTRHVTRRKKLADGTRGEAEEYHSDQDEEGKKRRQARRKKREEKIKKGGRDANSAGSAYSYRSVVSAGGTRHVTRRKKLADGTRGEAEDYHSDQDEEGKKRRQARRKQREEKIKKGGRDANSAGSAYSYRSVVSAGGTRRVKRRLKNKDGTRGEEEDYNSADDEEGKKRRQARRNVREKHQKEKLAKGGRDAGSDGSAYSYRSVVSAGGTRHVKRRKKNADGTRGKEEDYNSADDEEGKKRRQKRRQERKEKVAKGGRNAGSDSDYSYRSVRSAGGTRHVKRRKKLGDGKYADEEDYNSEDDAAGKERRMKRRQERRKAEKQGKRNANSDSDYSYRSVHSAGGTRHVRRRKKNADGTYGDDESYHSSQDEAGQERRRRRRRERKHAGSAHSYYSEVSVGGTRKVMRRRRRGDGTYSAAKSYHSSDSDNGKGKRGKKKRPPRVHGADSDHSYISEVSVGGTRRRKRVQRIRDKDGKVIGYGKEEAYTSDSSMEFVDDGKGGKMKVRKKKPVFEGSLASTDSDDEPDLSKMTKAQREKYLKDKAARKEEREKRRKEKFGDQYEEMMEKHKSQKAAEKAAKSQVHYQKGSDRFKDKTEYDDRQPGMGHSEWGSKLKGKGKKGRGGDGHDADDEGDDLDLDGTQRRKKKGGKGGDSDEESVYEYARDEKGNIIRDKDGKPIMKKVGTMKKKGGGKHREGVIDSDSEYEYMKDRHGNVVRKKKGVDEESDGDYFDVAPDGTVRLRKGKRKIDLSKLSHADLKKLGIDPETMTKEEIARILKAKFGDDITITKAGKRIGLKAADEMKGANTDDLADDSDLDTSTLKGQRRVRVLMRKGGQQILEHMKNVISNSDLVDEAHTHPEERDASIDFLNHYRLVDNNKVDMYARAFVVEDEDFDAVVNIREAKQALGGVPTIQSISKKQMDYIQKLLDLDKETHVTFRMFSVMTALAERVTAMDQYCKHLLEVSDLMDIQRKMELFKSMFYCNVRGDRDPNYIKADSLRIELIAGGLNWQQQDYVMEKMAPNEWREISFFDYLCYVPLFMSMHDKMVENPLDMSNSKYVPTPSRQPSPVQRDYNPLGYPLKRNSMFITNHAKSKDLTMKTDDLLPSKLSQDSLDLYKKYSKLPSIKSTKPDTTFTGRGKTKL